MPNKQIQPPPPKLPADFAQFADYVEQELKQYTNTANVSRTTSKSTVSQKINELKLSEDSDEEKIATLLETIETERSNVIQKHREAGNQVTGLWKRHVSQSSLAKVYTRVKRNSFIYSYQQRQELVVRALCYRLLRCQQKMHSRSIQFWGVSTTLTQKREALLIQALGTLQIKQHDFHFVVENEQEIRNKVIFCEKQLVLLKQLVANEKLSQQYLENFRDTELSELIKLLSKLQDENLSNAIQSAKKNLDKLIKHFDKVDNKTQQDYINSLSALLLDLQKKLLPKDAIENAFITLTEFINNMDENFKHHGSKIEQQLQLFIQMLPQNVHCKTKKFINTLKKLTREELSKKTALENIKLIIKDKIKEFEKALLEQQAKAQNQAQDNILIEILNKLSEFNDGLTDQYNRTENSIYRNEGGLQKILDHCFYDAHKRKNTHLRVNYEAFREPAAHFSVKKFSTRFDLEEKAPKKPASPKSLVTWCFIIIRSYSTSWNTNRKHEFERIKKKQPQYCFNDLRSTLCLLKDLQKLLTENKVDQAANKAEEALSTLSSASIAPESVSKKTEQAFSQLVSTLKLEPKLKKIKEKQSVNLKSEIKTLDYMLLQNIMSESSAPKTPNYSPSSFAPGFYMR